MKQDKGKHCLVATVAEKHFQRTCTSSITKGLLKHAYSKKILFWLTQVLQFSSVWFSHSVMSNSLWPHGLQHTRPPCPSPTPRVYPNSHPLSQWCHPTISSSVIPFSSYLQSFPASQGLFQWVSSLHQVAKVLEFQLQHQSFQWIVRTDFPLGLTGLISLLSKGLSRVFSNTTVWEY